MRLLIVVCLSILPTLAHAQLDEVKPVLGLQLLDAEQAVDVWKEQGGADRLAPKKGLMITAVPPGSVADRVGIQALDLLDKVNNKTVRDMKQVEEAIQKVKPGEMIQVQIRRLRGTGWHPIKGELVCSNARIFAYSQMQPSSKSIVADSLQLRHHAFAESNKLIAPVIVVRSNKPELYLETKHVGEDWLFARTLTIKIDSKAITVPLMNGVTEVRDGNCFESFLQPIPTELADQFRKTTQAKSILFRLDGKSEFTEGKLSEAWAEHVATVLSVFDDMVATNNTDHTLGGKIK